MRRAIVELAFERHAASEEESRRHVHTSRIFGPAAAMLPVLTRCEHHSCATAPDGRVWHGHDLLPLIVQMLEAREVDRRGVVECPSASEAHPACTHRITFRIVCEYAPA